MTLNTIIISSDEGSLERLCTLANLTDKLNVFDSFSSFDTLSERTADFVLIELSAQNYIKEIEFGNSLRLIDTGIVLFYIVSSPQQCYAAVKSGADFCIFPPVGEAEIKDIAERAYALSHMSKCRTEIHMFGKFGVFKSGKAVKFISGKSKELFALCADHCGADVTIEEAADKLWGDRPYDEKVKALYRKAVMNIRRTMKENHIDNVFSVNRGSCKINPPNVKCDYYRYKSAPNANLQLFTGEYLSDYSWAEETAATLHFQKLAILKTMNFKID